MQFEVERHLLGKRNSNMQVKVKLEICPSPFCRPTIPIFGWHTPRLSAILPSVRLPVCGDGEEISSANIFSAPLSASVPLLG